MPFAQIVFPSIGSLFVAVAAALIFVLQIWFSTKGPEFRWCRWAAAVSFSTILYALGIFVEYNAPQGPINRFGGLLEFTAVIFLVHALNGFGFSRLNIPSRRYHLTAGGLHALILILLWSTQIFVSDHFVARRFLFLERPFVEADLGPLGSMFMLYALLASVNAIRIWIVKGEVRKMHSRAHVWGASFWILMGAYDAAAALGFPSVQYIMEYGFLGFSATLLCDICSDFARTSYALGHANVALRKEMETRKRTEDGLRQSEERFRAIFEHSMDAIFFTAPDGRVFSANTAACEMTGYTENEIIELGSESVADPTDPRLASALEERKAKGRFRGEMNWKRKDGSKIPVEITSVIFTDKDAQERSTVIVRDITSRKQMEDELRKSEERYRRVLEDQTEAICRFREDGTFTFVNEVYCRFFAKQHQELIGKKWQPLTVAEDMPLMEAKLRSLSPSNPVVLVENRVYSGDKQVHWMQFVNRGFFDTEGRLIEIQSVGRDITNNKKLESQLFQAQKMESLGILVAGLSHEINNPVNTIMVNAPLLRKVWEDLLPILHEYAERDPCRKYGGLTADFLAENMGQLISDVDRAGIRISKIIKGLKEFAQKTGQCQAGLVKLEVSAANALNLAGSTARESGIALLYEAEKDLPAIRGDSVHVEQIVLNLLLNGMQAITHDHGKIQVVSGFQKASRRVFVSIEDNGSGIDPVIGNKAFDPFFTTRQTEGGTGLGLAVARSLVEAYGGEISYKSVKGRGTTFTVTFPIT